MSTQRILPEFVRTGLDSPITRVALLLVGQRDGHYVGLGSGVLLGHLIAITARHVVDGFSQYFEGANIEELGGEGTFGLQAIHFVEGNYGLAWDVREVYLNRDPGFCDIVFLRLQAVSQKHLDNQGTKPRLQLLPPRLGQVVSAFGYHSTRIEVAGERVSIDTNPFTAAGRVLEIHDEKRDSTRLSFPCFRTDARYDPGMSGGPVFNEVGYLCGIICSNMPPDSGDPEGGHISYVSTLWPSMGILVSYDRAGYDHGVWYPAIELAQSGFIAATDLDKVAVAYDAATGQMTVQSLREPL
jgi:hypothetical protein